MIRLEVVELTSMEKLRIREELSRREELSSGGVESS